MRTDNINRNLYQELLRAKAGFVVANVGGNDISPTSTPDEIFRRIVEIAEDLYESGVKTVYIAEVLTRGDFSKCQGLTRETKENQEKKRKKEKNYKVSVLDTF